jgi:hypothetical protein
MTKRSHAIIEKRVINLDHLGDRHVMCAWDTCEKDGFDLHQTRVNYGADGAAPHIVKHVFCTERHKMFWVNSVRNLGNLPPGYKRSFI